MELAHDPFASYNAPKSVIGEPLSVIGNRLSVIRDL